MKKLLLIGLLFLGGFILTGCNEILDGPGMERDDNIPEGGEWITAVTDMCEEQGGVVEQWFEGGDKQDVCYFDDKTFCYLEDFAAGNCKKGDMSYINDGLEDELAECDAEGEDIVCGKDGNTYYNRCYLDFAGVEEETELAEVISGQCVFG